jgi:hypothetical protein
MPVASPRTSSSTFPPAPRDWPEPRSWSQQIADVLNGVLDGKLNSCFTVTLTANAATTTVENARIRANSAVLLMPTTANAAAALATTYQTHPNTMDGQAVLTHTNNAQTDRTFRAFSVG